MVSAIPTSSLQRQGHNLPIRSLQSGMASSFAGMGLSELCLFHGTLSGDWRSGAAWVQNSFDLLGLPEIHLLDRFHALYSLRRSFASVLGISELSKELFSQGFSAGSAWSISGAQALLAAMLHKQLIESRVWAYLPAGKPVSRPSAGRSKRTLSVGLTIPLNENFYPRLQG